MTPQLQSILQQAIQSFQDGNLIGSELMLKRVLQIDSKSLPALHILGLIKASQSRYSEAAEFLGKAARISPHEASIQYNLAKALADCGREKESISHHKKAVELAPNNPEAWFNYGKSQFNLKDYAAAITCYDRAISLRSDYAEVWCSKGFLFYVLEQYVEALDQYNQAISIKSDYVEALYGVGLVLDALKLHIEAIEQFDRVIALRPDNFDAWYSRGLALRGLSQQVEAKLSFKKALELNPKFEQARWAIPFLSIPHIFSKDLNPIELRSEFLLEIEELSEWFSNNKPSSILNILGFDRPFYLAYQELNNKELLSAYGKLCGRLMGEWQQEHDLQPTKKRESGKIIVGIVSGHIHNHSVWNAIVKGWLEHLDSNAFEIHLFSLGGIVDEESNFAKMKATSFTNNQASLLDWAKEIISKNIEVLIYPEIGMNQLTTQLANLRLAPIQMVSWGHPESTGFPTIDYYLSAELFEDESSQNAYTETLVQLPNLGCSYSRLPITASKFTVEDFGIAPDEPILVCPGTLFKYAPQYDWVLVEIAKRLGKCKFVFFDQQKNWSKILKDRLETQFHKANLVIDDYIVFIPWLSPEEFYGLMEQADLFLDSLGFSGFNTAMQAIDCALPIATREGKFMRGRLAGGILKRMSLPELIAKTDHEYIDLVVQLVQDKSYRDQISKKIIERREVLYDDLAPIKALENFLVSKARD